MRRSQDRVARRRAAVLCCLGIGLGALGAGCGSEALPPAVDLGARGSFAVLQVERARFDGALPGERFEHYEIGARFVRYSGLEREDALAILGVHDLDEPDDLDGCTPPQTVMPAEALAADVLDRAELELVDLGPIEAESGGRAHALEPQSFPGLLNLMQGAIYGASETETGGWEPGAEWSFGSRGAAGIGPFETAIETPAELVVTRIAGQDPSLGLPTVDRQDDLRIHWEAGDAGDTIRIELDWSQLGAEMRLRCAATDDGAFVVPEGLLRQLPDSALVSSPRLIVRRSRHRAFSAVGLDQALVAASLVESFEIRVR